MKNQLNKDKIARALGAVRRGQVTAAGGYFGAVQLLAEIHRRFRVPAGGGRATDPTWTERRLVPLAPTTLARLEELVTQLRRHSQLAIEPMQLAGLLLEQSTQQFSAAQLEELAQAKRTRG